MIDLDDDKTFARLMSGLIAAILIPGAIVSVVGTWRAVVHDNVDWAAILAVVLVPLCIIVPLVCVVFLAKFVWWLGGKVTGEN